MHTLPPPTSPAPAAVPPAQRGFLVAVVGLLLVAPLLGAWVRWGGLPPGFQFPPLQGEPKAPFSPAVLLALATPVVLFTALVCVPRWFGFRPPEAPAAPVERAPLPAWGWAGGAVMVAGWTLMWAQPPALASITPFAFTPQWWGLILLLDGLVYARSGGRSLAGSRPWTLVALAVFSSISWWLYEYLNLFLLEDWYYPQNDIWPHAAYPIAYSLAYTTISPAVVEWTMLLGTIPGFSARYTHGPRLSAGRGAAWAAVAAGLVVAFAASVWPNELFFTVWLGPDLVMAGALALLGLWTPASPVARGDWSALVVPAVACMANGFVWECWNYWSAPSNPHFWKYDVPYVHVAQIFEMPALGFFGYAPFGVSVWISWLLCAAVFGLDPALDGGRARRASRDGAVGAIPLAPRA